MTSLRAQARYLRTVLRHKWFVLVAGRRLEVPYWRLITHDLSKFSRSEWGPYVRRFAAGRAGAMDHDADSEEWKRAWEHHWMNNPHHWEYWLSGGVPTPIPTVYVLEMVADWLAAGRAYTGSWDNVHTWYEKNRDRIKLWSGTRTQVEWLLAEIALGWR